MQACVIPSVRVRQSPTVKRALDPASTQLRAKKASQRSPYARAIIATVVAGAAAVPAAALVSHTLTYTFPLAQKLRVLSRVQLLYASTRLRSCAIIARA